MLRAAVLLLAPPLSALMLADRASAYDYAAHVNLGLYQAQEKFTEDFQETDTNDARVVLGSAFLDVTKIGSAHTEFTFDFRDKYDAFGRVDPVTQRLVGDNEPQLRQLAFKSPYETGRVEWAVGRFPVANASVLGNDGAELGFKVQPKLSLGLFGGLNPEQHDGRTTELGLEDTQGGIFGTYEDHGSSWGKSTFATTAFVFRAPNPKAYPSPELPGAAPPTPVDPTTPVVVTDPEPLKDYVFWYTNIIHQPSPSVRYTYLSTIDIQPALHIRDLWASAFRQVTPKLSATITGMHLDLTEYERQRDLLDTLPDSTFTELKGEAKYKLSRVLMVGGDLLAGDRGEDGKTKAEANLRLTGTSLAGGHLVAFGGAGYRKNFISHDTVFKAGGSYFTSHLELDLTQQYITEVEDVGITKHPLITDVSIGAMMSDSLLGSVELEYAKDEQVTITSMLLTIGFRTNNRQLTPIRDRAPRLERL